MSSLFTSEIQSIAASGRRLGDVRRHSVARALADKRRRALIQTLLYRLEAAAYAVASFGVIAIAALCLISTVVVGAVMVIAGAAY